MAGSGAWKRLKSLLRKDDAPLFLNDTSAFDFSDEVGDEGLSRFNKLRVVVADDGSEIPERPVNGAHPALQADDDSLLDQDLPLTNSQLSLKVDACDNCSRQRELLKQRKVKTRLTIAAVLYLLFMIGELVGGYIANSLAVMTDALHMLTDLSAIILTLLALWLSSKSPTKRFTFGFHRLEVLSAMISVLLVYILMGFLLYEAVQRTIHMKYEINGDIMLITAAVGVAVNVMFWVQTQPWAGQPSSESCICTCLGGFGTECWCTNSCIHHTIQARIQDCRSHLYICIFITCGFHNISYHMGHNSYNTRRCTKPFECRLYQRSLDENRRCIFSGRFKYLVSHFRKTYCHSTHTANSWKFI
ncbi:probable proton-coupled zinc antiporter SLC30A4 isoform X2 [Acinonyx jubatus]|uniref:Probable proton-coupled zinc antiporter SLC30A4 isoform X2 n=1 Tax=Acinonyx jubatus TaxID=32536 RepID=A0A6J2A0K8_ACIJB|nr:probable proton-coupled zinc antiporter SLC30A4 isoform X2 [Acinonyx jubatus]